MQSDSNYKSGSHIRDVAVSVVVVTLCSMLGMLAGYVMGANDREREWAMLYCVAFIGAISSFYCMIKLTQIVRLLSHRRQETD